MFLGATVALNVLSFFRDEVPKSKRISQYLTPELHSVSLLASGSALQAFRGAAQFYVRVLLWINCPESHREPTSGYFQNKAHHKAPQGCRWCAFSRRLWISAPKVLLSHAQQSQPSIGQLAAPYTAVFAPGFYSAKIGRAHV